LGQDRRFQFISALVDEGLLTFDHAGAQWRWDLSRIKAKGYTDNVADLMVDKLRRLPIATTDVLSQLASLGNSAQIGFLSVVQQDSEDKVHADLWEALRAELVVRSDTSYRFVHDRVQEAVYSSIPQELRAGMHLGIGRLLAAHIRLDQREEAIFDIVGQFDRSADLITSREEREQVAEFYLIAGKRAKPPPLTSALRYLVCGSALLTEDCWERQNDLIFQLELHRCECEYLTGELETAEARLTMLASRASTIVDQATVVCLRIDLYVTLGRIERAIDVGLAYLRDRGVEWSPHPTEIEARREYERTWSLLGGCAIEELIALPLMSDHVYVATLDVLTKVMTPALFTDPNLLTLTACRMVNLSVEHGNADASCFAYARLGQTAGSRFGNYQAGFRFGRLGYDLVERFGFERFKARTYNCFGRTMCRPLTHQRTPNGYSGPRSPFLNRRTLTSSVRLAMPHPAMPLYRRNIVGTSRL
jgi:predicted ATPase